VIIGYARTSTVDQVAGLADQESRLTAAGCSRVYTEHISGAEMTKRAQLESLMGFIREGDTLCVTKLDRLTRSVADLLSIVTALNDKGASLRILDLGGSELDTKSPMGRMFLVVTGAFAEFERGIMLERQKAGIAAAKRDGKYKGRPDTVRRQSAAIYKLADEGHGCTEIARRVKGDRTSVWRVLKARALGIVAAQ
jgi:DNA invertase Pin-like site-specific DNA recombinase